MGTGRPDRLWVIGGVLGAVALLAIGWLFLISPQNAQTSHLNDRAAAAELRLETLQRRLADLRQQSGNLPRYREQLARDRQALPTMAALSDFLRELQAAGDGAGVAVSGVNVGAPTPVTAAKQVFVLPITLTASGTAARLNQLLDQLQRVQPRAVLINNVSTTPEQQNGSLAGTVVLTLALQAFVSPASGVAGAPSAKPTN
jgi:Tfp pilus assembly protein PilO